MKDCYAWNVRFVISSQRDFGFIPNLVPGPAKRIGRMFSKKFCDKQMTWNHFPLLSDFKDNKTFNGLVLAWAIVSVSSPSGCFKPNFSWAGCDSYVGSKEWKLLLCHRAVFGTYELKKLFVLCDLNMLQTHTVKLQKLQKNKQ